jgi:hypothetical protein
MFFDLQEYYHSSFIGYMMLHGIQYWQQINILDIW